MSSRKNPFAAVAIAASLNRHLVDFKLTMLGDGPQLRAVADAIRSESLEDRVHLAGRVPAAQELQRATAVIHTSHWEGLPRALLEATSIGRPTYGFDVKGTRDIPGITLIEPGDFEAFGKILSTDLLDCRKLQTMVRTLPAPSDLSYTCAAEDLSTFMIKLAK